MDFVPDADGVESIAKEIKLTGRSYPLFQIALLVLERPARYTIRLRVQKKPGGEVPQRLFARKLEAPRGSTRIRPCGTLWASTSMNFTKRAR